MRIEDLEIAGPGEKVLWHFETTRGWGGDFWVPASLVRLGRKRVLIAAQLKDGGTKEVWVHPAKLEWRSGCNDV